jgi:hypothetical protein
VTTASQAFEELVGIARQDPRLLAIWVDGSRGKGRAGPYSDHDATLIVADEAAADFACRFIVAAPAGLDLRVMTLAAFEGYAAWGGPQAWDRYNFAHLTPLLDKTGRIAALMAEKARVPPEALADFIDRSLDHFINQIYRALKAGRDGLAAAARVEAAQGVTPLLDALFALHGGRLRPYAKYLEWEFEAHPLERLPWPPDALVAALLEIVAAAAPDTLRVLLRGTEGLARDSGHGAVFDAWGDALCWMRGDEAPAAAGMVG